MSILYYVGNGYMLVSDNQCNGTSRVAKNDDIIHIDHHLVHKSNVVDDGIHNYYVVDAPYSVHDARYLVRC